MFKDKFSNDFWVKAVNPIRNSLRRFSTKSTLSQSFSNDPESFAGIQEWINTQSYEALSTKTDFNIFTNFVCAYEFVPDTSPFGKFSFTPVETQAYH